MTNNYARDTYGFEFFSNAYNSSTKASDNPYFQLQSEPTGNNTASPSATFNLLFANNGGSIAETGFYINSNGTLHFASGQTFPGTGTITGVRAGTNLTGGGTSGVVTLNLDTTKILTGVTAGSGLIGGGTTGTVTLAVDTNKIPTLSGTNSFSGSNTFGPSIYENTDVNIDNANSNSGYISPGLRFGNASGEGIASQRTSSGNTSQYGLDLYTGYTPRMSITAGGKVGIGIATPGGQLDVLASSAADTYEAIEAVGGLSDSGGDGSHGIFASGGNPGPSSGSRGGAGGVFQGGDSAYASEGGYGIYAGGGGQPGTVAYNYAGVFESDIEINGTDVSDVSSTKVDHPSDPANKYLVHVSVQSSEMMNMYTGNVTTDGAGRATVALPAWFEAENADFRYQLTVVGQFAQAVVKEEIANGQFTIMTSSPGVKVSWLVTAVRQDAYAKAHPIVVKVAKPAREVGFYRHPELYGQPATKQTEWGRNPRMMQRMEAQRTGIKARKPPVGDPAVGARPQIDTPYPAGPVALTRG